MSLGFHWRLAQGREACGPALDEQIEQCRAAEELGLDSLLVDFNLGKPDPMVLALPLALATRRIKLMVAHRPGLMSPALFVQQVNTFSALTGGRILLNLVAGHSPAEQRAYGDPLGHDERFRRMDEFLTVCRRFWAREGPVSFGGEHYRVEEGRLNTPFVSPESTAPRIFLGGGSRPAREVAARHASCWMRFGDTPEALARDLPDSSRAPEVGVRLSVVVRASREEAVEAARRLVPAGGAARRESEVAFVRASDSQSVRSTLALADREWLTPCLWTGAVPFLGATSLALVGTPDEVAAGLLDYARVGITQFILSGWPQREEMVRFGREVLPRVRRAERRDAAQALREAS